VAICSKNCRVAVIPIQLAVHRNPVGVISFSQPVHQETAERNNFEIFSLNHLISFLSSEKRLWFQ